MASSKSTTEWMPCVLCGSYNSKVLFTQEYKGVDYSIVKCKCGLVYTNPRYVLENKSDFYRDPKVDDKGTTIGLRADACIQPRFGFREKYLEFYDDKVYPRVLDYVCRGGSFLEVLRQRYGWHSLYGLDDRPMLAKEANTKGFYVLNQTIEQANFTARFFDIVVMRHTLEHLYNPNLALKEVHRVLKDDGRLRIEVPHINSLSRKLAGNRWSAYFIPWHLYYFDKSSLARLLDKNGFEVESLTTFPYPHYLLSPLRYLRFAIKDTKQRKIVGKSLDDSEKMGALLYPLNKLSVALGMGDELIAVVKKK
jgi:SAM-dependent methyltransferase